MITCTLPVKLDSGSVRVDHVSTEDALKWLTRHIHGAMRFDYNAEAKVRWRIRWAAWPYIHASGAGRTFEQAISRCFQMAYREHSQVRWATEKDLKEAGF